MAEHATFQTDEFKKYLQNPRTPSVAVAIIVHAIVDGLIIFCIWANLSKKRPRSDADEPRAQK
jgi:hypothetical protein